MKRFLSLFAIVALIVSMFSGVGFAAVADIDANTTYELDLDGATGNDGVFTVGYKEDVVVDITGVSGAGSGVVGDINDCNLALYNSTTHEELNYTYGVTTETATLAGTDLKNLTAGTYDVTISGAKYDETASCYYIDLDDSDDYDVTLDATFDVVKVHAVAASINNITAGEKKSALVGTISSFGDIMGDDLSLYIKDSKGTYVLLSSGVLEDSTTPTPADLDNSDTVIDSTVDGTILNANINTVELLSATFTDTDPEIGGTDVLEYFSKNNSTGTIDLRIVVTDANLVNGVASDSINIDFSYSAIPLKIELNEDMFYFDENGGNVTISGKIVNKNTDATYDYDKDDIVALADNGDRVFNDNFTSVTGQVDSVNNGQFDITFNAYNENDGSEFFWVRSEDNVPQRGDYFFVNDCADHFVLTPEFEIDSDLEFEFPFSETIEIDGVFVNEDNSFDDGDSDVDETGAIDKTEIELRYLNGFNEFSPDGDLIATAVLANDRVFGFLDAGDAVTMTGDIGLFFDGVLVMKGEVAPGELSVEISPDEVPNNLEDQEITFTFDLPTDYLADGADNLIGDSDHKYQLILAVENEDEEQQDLLGSNKAKTIFGENDPKDVVTAEGSAPAGYVTIVDYDTDYQFTDASDQEVTVALPVDGWVRGTYTAYVKLYDVVDDTVVQENSVEFEVEKPAAYNLIGWGLDETSVGKTTFSFNKAADVKQTIVVKDDEGTEIEFLEVVFNGCGLDDETFATQDYDEDVTEDDFEISVSETGTLEVKINVYDSADDDTPDKTFTEQIKVTGWNVTVTPSEIVVGSEEDVVFTVTDEDGDPINNAIITINDIVVVNGTTSSIIGGVYTYEYDEDTFEFDTVDEFDVKFYKGAFDESDLDADLEVTLEGGLEVIGEEVYTVEVVENPVMLNGLEEDIKVSVLDADGDIVYPTFYRIDVEDDGDEVNQGEITGSALGSYSDVDGVAGKEARTITLTPDDSQQAIIIRATTDDGAKMGEVRIEVQKPQLVIEGGQNLTENFKNNLEFTIIDPRDDSVLENDVYLKADNEIIDYSVEDAEESPVTITDGESEAITFDDTYKFEVYVDDVNWELAEDEEEDVEISLYIVLDEEVKITDFEIKKATLTSDPESVIIGAGSNITLTYTDANGNPLEDYEITLDEEEIGTTDENGQASYSTQSTSSVSLTFEAETDDSDDDDSTVKDDDDADTTKTTVKVKSAADTQAPVATYVVNGRSAIITFTDNVRLLKSFVNMEEVTMHFPMPTATHIVEGLKVGDNEVHVLSSDAKGNILDTTLVITVEETAEPVVFTIGEETTYGTPVLVGDTTMVPVRFAQDLGAVVEWDNATQTVTYTLGETKIAMTIGSKTAVVNGENVQLTEAPYKNELGRTMVPLRMIAKELGYTVDWTSNDAPITIK